MVVKMPDMDAGQMPELAAPVARYAMRSEVRLDGSSVLEGRMRVPPYCRRTIATERIGCRGHDSRDLRSETAMLRAAISGARRRRGAFWQIDLVQVQ